MKPTFKNRPNIVHKVGDREVWESRSTAVVAVILAYANNKIYVLGEKRSNIMPDAPNLWVVPCGYIDWDENGWNALRREVYEETSFFIDTYKDYIVYDNNKEPFFVNTEVTENRQNIALTYCVLFDFEKRSLPKDVELHTDKEIAAIKWIPIEEISKYKWAFDHEKRIQQALNKIEVL